MCAVLQALYETVRKRDPAQSEFLQAVEEVCAPHLSKALPQLACRTHCGKLWQIVTVVPSRAALPVRSLCFSELTATLAVPGARDDGASV